MKKVTICTAAVFLLLNWTALGFSEQVRELGTEIAHITYKEPGVMKEKGMMYGIVGSYAYHDNVMLKAEGNFSYGQVKYDGGLSDGTPYTTDGIDDYLLELRGLVGYDFSIGESMIFTPYVGLGYRYLYDRLGKDPYGYDRESNYLYSPIGIAATIPLRKGWSIGPTVEYDIFLHGWQVSHFEDLNPIYDTVVNDQKKGYGIRGSLKIQKKAKKLDFLIEPFVRYWNIKQSETSAITILGTYVVGYGWEPKNNSTEIGCKLAVHF